ncbi:MAG: valine--tRNA ligase [Clostridia bacterium]|nr:valine--tRNA ligase [Clostridia bacterium]
MAKELEKVYNPADVEDRIYQMWVENGCFNAEVDEKKPPYCIVIPPPNVTGQLHMGHAMDETLQDILIRTKRMQGYSALWLPGTDHAGIATQIKVEENLRKTSGKTRYDYGRDAFIDLVWDWKREYGSRIINQLKKLGASCDWRRERFTMDEGCSKAVREVFVRLWEKGLIYRGNRIINWCPNCTTALSDAEVEYSEQNGHFWHIRYPFADGSGYLTIATTRPETLLGDTAVAVNPEDERYTDIVGKNLILPLVGREIPVIADEYVDREFGTGCVKITPCHDPNDFEVGKRHNLPEILVLDDDAKVINGGVYNGLDRYEARKRIVADLEAAGLLERIEAHAHNVGSCYRCGTTVEPIASKQWFVKMKPLAEDAIKVVKDGKIEFVPERFNKTYMNWMENVRDWCISRQLWWGHRIPAWYCADCGETIVARETPTVCPKCGCTHLTQDEDVLDTWFSSALWPFATLGWPEKTPELDYFYPTSTLVTGYDIIFFWVARMIFSGMEHMGKEPFKTVFFHGLVRDAQGRKMSKSLGNGIDPLEIISQYGADALRFTLVTGISPGNDTRFTIERVEASRNFANKLWNATRFVLMHTGDTAYPLPKNLRREDKWILTALNQLIAEVTENLDKFDLGVAAQKVYDFVWDSFCDWYIELAKPMLFDGGEAADAAKGVLLHVLDKVLRLLHPFMPFVTEEIYGCLPGSEGKLITAEWPKADPAMIFEEDRVKTEQMMDVIRAIRNRRAEMNVPPSKKATLTVMTADKDAYIHGEPFICKLASVSEIRFADANDAIDEKKMTRIICGSDNLLIPTGELVDLEKELARLKKELAKNETELTKLNAKLANPGFVSKAPANVVEAEQRRAVALAETVEAAKAAVAALEQNA